MPLTSSLLVDTTSWISRDEQLSRWVAGDSVHRGPKDSEYSECCPDFSCCKPALQQPRDVRLAYATADMRSRNKFGWAFLGVLIDDVEANVQIAGPALAAS